MAKELMNAIRVGVPIALMAELGKRETLARAFRHRLNFAGDGLHLAEFALGSDVTDKIDAEPNRVAGNHARPVLVRVLVPAAAKVVRRHDDGSAAANIHAEELWRALKLAL